jgi:hypothetical protein
MTEYHSIFGFLFCKNVSKTFHGKKIQIFKKAKKKISLGFLSNQHYLKININLGMKYNCLFMSVKLKEDIPKICTII